MLSWAVMVELLLMFVVMTLNTNRFCCPTAPRPHCCVILSLFCSRLAVQRRSLPARPAAARLSRNNPTLGRVTHARNSQAARAARTRVHLPRRQD